MLKNKSIFIFIVIFQIALLTIVIKASTNNLADNKDEKLERIQTYEGTEEDLEVGRNGLITELLLTETITGTGPFDENDDPGNDKNEINNIVRTFDQVIWTVEATMQAKQVDSTSNLTGGALEVKAELPVNCIGKVKWDIESMAWTKGTETISEDGRTFTAYYQMDSESINIPGQQTIVLVAKVLGAENGLSFNPTFTMSVVGNEEGEEKSIQGSENITVSATPKYNISIVYHDSKQQIEINGVNKNILKNSLGFMIEGENESKGIKGIEIPTGHLNFDIKYNLYRVDENTQERVDITQYMRLYNYKYNENWNSDGLSENTENIMTEFPNSFLCSNRIWPWSSNDGERDEESVVYQNGNLTMVDDGEGTIHVTISNYGISDKFPVRYDLANNNVQTFTDNIGVISVGMFYMEYDINDKTNMEGTQLYFELEAINMSVNTIGGTTQTEEVRTDDNTQTGTIIIDSNNEYNKQVHFSNEWEEYYSTEWGTGDATGYPGQERMYILNIVNTDENNTNNINGIDIFTKFDDKIMEARLETNGDEYKVRTVEYGDSIFNILYGGKADKTGWTSDTEMNETTMDELIYFDTLEELKSEGYVCVATLAESISVDIKPGFDINLLVPMKIKDTARINYVGQILNDIRIYEEAPNRDTQTHLTVENQEPLPTVVYSIENLEYVKTEYDENGQIVDGTHLGSVRRGDSIIILGAIPSISIKSENKDGYETTNFDIGLNENEVRYEIRPTLTTVLTTEVTGVNLKIKSVLPKGLSYVEDSSNIENIEVTTDEKTGETTLTWYLYNVTVGETISPIEFNAHIDETTINGTQYQINAMITEIIEDGEISKIGNPGEYYRVATSDIQIINMESYLLYKLTQTPVIERNGKMQYSITFKNNTMHDLSTFQLLDILPYNGDNRGTSYNGEYKLDRIEIIGQTGLAIYTTNDSNIREEGNVKDSNIITKYNWEETSGDLSKDVTAIFIDGTVEDLTTVQINLYLTTIDSEPKDVYINNATVQTNVDSPQITTTNVKVQVVKRELEGTAW